MISQAQEFKEKLWALAIFSSRERASQLMETVRAAACADRCGATLLIDLIINGNRPLAAALSEDLSTLDCGRQALTIRLWHFPRPDKADAWNHYLHTLMPTADLVFFIDGYVNLEPTSLYTMANALIDQPDALAATCTPCTGRSAARLRQSMLSEGGLHGNFYALQARAAARLRDARFRLPTGIYRNDSTLGAVLAFDLDPAQNSWRVDRIIAAPDALYSAPALSALRLADLRTAFRRRLRQAQGTLENMAIRAHLAIARRPPSTLPGKVRDLILDWADSHPAQAKALLWNDPLAWLTLFRLRRRNEPAPPVEEVQYLGRFSYCTTPATRLDVDAT